ncbi:MAG: hypothetical protein ACI8XO_004861 [Verrucomicrobiales bacterium]|jgi:hypothetical protein
MPADSPIVSSLDALSQEGGRWLWKTRLRDGLRVRLPMAITLLLAVPLLAVLVTAAGWMTGQPWKFPLGVGLVLWLVPSVIYLSCSLMPLWEIRPTRRESLAVFDEQLGLKDRLQTADEFLAVAEPSPFMEAAIGDTQVAIEQTRHRPLEWKWGEPWGELKRLSLVVAAALLVGIAWIFLPAAKRTLTEAPDAPEIVQAAGENQPEVPAKIEAETSSANLTEVSPPDEKSGEPPVAKTPKVAKGEPTPSEKVDAEATELTGREKISLGESEGSQNSQSASAGRSSRSTGSPGSQAPSSTPDKKPLTPKKKKDKEAKESKDSKKEDKDKDEKSGSTAGRGSSSGSSRNPASTDWSSKDRTEETETEEFEQEEEVDDEDSESEARGGLQPSLRDRRPPVNRDLSLGFGMAEPNPDANGRGGPGQRKKSRGVASLVLGVPVPDHVKGQPNPGRVKINQERVQPQREESPNAEAEDRGQRSAPAGRIPERILDATTRRVVREFFLKARESATNPNP